MEPETVRNNTGEQNLMTIIREKINVLLYLCMSVYLYICSYIYALTYACLRMFAVRNKNEYFWMIEFESLLYRMLTVFG